VVRHGQDRPCPLPLRRRVGGLFQGAAAFPALRARDGLAAGIHAIWGAFWIGFGILFGLQAAGVLPASAFGSVNTAFAFWFIVLALVTGTGAMVAGMVNWAVCAVLTFFCVTGTAPARRVTTRAPRSRRHMPPSWPVHIESVPLFVELG
jgi:succinate-acetate transporter protein